MLCTLIGMGEGVSLGVARRFSREGFAIAMLARDTGKLAGIDVANSRAFAADASDESSLRTAMETVEREMGAAEVLVYNASAGHSGRVSQLRAEDMVADYRANVVGPAIAAQMVLPQMRKAGRGTILFTGGGLALDPYPEYASLAAGKAGIRNLAMSLAKECEPEGIHVATVTICGFVQEGTHFSPDQIAEEYWRLYEQPLEEWERESIYR